MIVKCLTDTDVCKVKVVVSCKNVLPVINSSGVIMNVFVVKSAHYRIAILGRMVNDDLYTGTALIEKYHIVLIINNLISHGYV